MEPGFSMLAGVLAIVCLLIFFVFCAQVVNRLNSIRDEQKSSNLTIISILNKLRPPH